MKVRLERPLDVISRRPLEVRLGRPQDVRSGRPQDRQIGTSPGPSNRILRALRTLEGDVLGTSWGPIFAGWEDLRKVVAYIDTA